METLRIAVGQLPNRVGDLAGNVRRIAETMTWAEREADADVLVLPELALTGYGLGDLVLHREFLDDAGDALHQLAAAAGRMTTVVGTVERVPPRRSWDTAERHVAISAALLADGEVRGSYHKRLLPTYDLFDEARTFAPGQQPDQLWRIGDVVLGVAICEDLWSPDGPPEAQSVAGARLLLAPNASPFHRGKAGGRLANTRAVARRNGLPVVYVNFVGGQDELAFDGGSIVVDGQGTLLHRGREFAEDRFWLDVPIASPRPIKGPVTNVHTRPALRCLGALPESCPREPLDDAAATWHAIVTGLRDHVARNGFAGVALGLSDGVDSAVTAALAVDAVGPDSVFALTMPSPETGEEETAGAEEIAANLGIRVQLVPVEAPSTEVELPAPARDATADDSRYDREHGYHRARAAMLTDMFEERGHLILATGNKSEISVGAASLFGSLAGQFAPLKDCPKTLVYELARWRNRHSPVISEATLCKAATAQRLAPRLLPSFEALDDIVQRYIEHRQGLSEIVEAGHDPDTVQHVLRRIDGAELIRRYTPMGVKVTSRAFNQDRRMPVSNEWRTHQRRLRGAPVAPAGEETVEDGLLGELGASTTAEATLPGHPTTR